MRELVKRTRRNYFRLLLVIIMALHLPIMAYGAEPASVDRVKGLSAEIGQITSGQARTSLDAVTGYARFVGVDNSNAIVMKGIAAGSGAEVVARAFLARYGAMFGIQDHSVDLATGRIKEADGGRSFVRFQQVYNTVPVFGGEMVVQTVGGYKVLSAGGKTLPNASVDTTPVVTPRAAEMSALSLVAKKNGLSVSELSVTVPELWIYNPSLLKSGMNTTSLVWRMEVTPADSLLPIKELVLVDAHTGTVNLSFNQIPHALNRQVYDKGNVQSDTLPGTLVRSEGQAAVGDTDIDKAYSYAGDTYNFYFNNHGRNSIDNAGMTIISTVRFCYADAAQSCPLPNAFWNGSQMVYGQGYASADDVVGHELTHGVTSKESNLFYYYQSGAINESLSDVWGEFVDLINGVGNDTSGVRWLMGEDLAAGAIRNMSNPPAYNDPDKMSSTLYVCSESDQGGVHTNSGINNKAAFLMVDGGTFNGKTVTGIGITKTAKIYYEAATNLLVSASDYFDLYNALQQACITLTGTAGITASDCLQVKNAIDAVEMSLQPALCAATEAPLCPAGKSASNIFYDNIEAPAWTVGALTGSVQWFLFSEYATSGTTSLWGKDVASINDSWIKMPGNAAIPSGADPVYMRFNHAFDFEVCQNPTTFLWEACDGGVVEYSTDSGTTWNDAAALFTDNGYTGTITTSWDNPIRGRQGFVGDSNGYGSSRLSLDSLKGQNVTFRFRVGSDSGVSDMGWFIDDVRVYKCIFSNTAPTLGTLTPSAVTSAVNSARSFAAVYSDANGAYDIKSVDLLINGPLNAANAIKLNYNRSINKLYLYNDAGSAAVGSCTPGVAGTLQNTQGILNCASTSVTAVGNDLTVNWSITPKTGGLGYKNMFMKATDNSNATTVWTQKGTWTVTSASNVAPAVVSLTPSTLVSAPASAQTLTGVFRDNNGVADLKTMEMLINASLSSVNGIRVSYSKSVNKLYLYNDAGNATVGSCTPGVAGTIQNTQGILDCGVSTVSASATDQTVNLRITPQAAFAGTRMVYMQVIDNSNASTGWIQKGTWTVKSANTAPTVVSVAPSAPTTAVNVAQTFTAVYRDSDGGGNHKASDILVNSSLSTVNGIYADYNRSSNKLYLYNDAGTATVGSCTPGVAGTIQNTRGMLDCGATTVTQSGTDLTIGWRLTARIGFTGAKKVYLKATDNSNATSGWIQKGTWTIQ